MASWKTVEHLEDHYNIHRREFPGASIEAYDASAQETLVVGTYFEYFDERTSAWRTGCYHRETRRLTVLDEADRIVSHFRCDERYVEWLTDSSYG